MRIGVVGIHEAYSCASSSYASLVGIVAQADVAREAKDKDSGQMLHDTSQMPLGPRL
jgi:hypothetical protein